MTEGPAARPGRAVVIGLGNPWRRDDGVGPAVADAVAAGAGGSVEVAVLDGEPGRLMARWSGADIAVVVDATRAGDPPGTVRVLGAELAASPTSSSHGLGLAHAVELGRRLDALPRRLVVVGIAGADFSHGRSLSPLVAAAVAPAARLVSDLVDRASPE